MNKDNKN